VHVVKGMEKELKAAREVLARHKGGDVLSIEEAKTIIEYCKKAGCQKCEIKKDYRGECPIIVGINE
jgi:hypothetical protein